MDGGELAGLREGSMGKKCLDCRCLYEGVWGGHIATFLCLVGVITQSFL